MRLAALALLAGATAAHADTGTYHRCLIEGEAPAEVYMDGSGRSVTFDVRGERHEVRAQGGHFKIKVGSRAYNFDPKFLNPPGVLVITTLGERRTVQCITP